jgi:hypothetical protein
MTTFLSKRGSDARPFDFGRQVDLSRLSGITSRVHVVIDKDSLSLRDLQ